MNALARVVKTLFYGACVLLFILVMALLYLQFYGANF